MRDFTKDELYELIQVGQRQPAHQTVVELRLALEEIDRLYEERCAQIEASKDVSAAGGWRAIASSHVPHEDLQQRREQPAPIPQPREPPHPELVAAFHDAEEETSRQEAWRRDDAEQAEQETRDAQVAER